MASLPYPLNRQNNHGRVGMAGMPYPSTDCCSYIKMSYSYNEMGTRLSLIVNGGVHPIHIARMMEEYFLA